MKIPKYVLVIDNKGEKGGKLLYNTIYGGKWLLDEEVIQKILSNKEDKENIKVLLDTYTIVEDDFNEEKFVDESLTSIVSEYNAIIVTNYSCNMQCSYCFEKEVSEKEKRLKEEDIPYILKRIESKIADGHRNYVSLNFTGGEPILNLEFIIKFMDRFIEEIVTRYNIAYSIDLTTNGTLLTPDVVKKLKKYNFTAAQITIDGPERIHNTVRRLKNNTDSFHTIMNNINAVSRDLKITIRTNYSHENIQYLSEYMECLIDNIKDFNNISLVFKPVQDCLNCKNTVESLEIVDKLCEVIDLAKKYNINVNGEATCTTCKIHSNNNEVISPEGEVYRCYMLVGNKQYSLGNWRENTENTKVIEEFNNMKSWKECLDCKLVGLCRGSCSYESLVKNNDFNKPVCTYDSNYKILKHFLQTKYEI